MERIVSWGKTWSEKFVAFVPHDISIEIQTQNSEKIVTENKRSFVQDDLGIDSET